jgi:EmrB/QacA subfamily drug resistance transporter
MPFIALGVSMIIVDATIVNVAIPSIQLDIGLTVPDAEWVNSLYSLVFASLLLTTGRIGDIVGRRRLFVIGVVVFVLASLVAAASHWADSVQVLILGRFLQGIGGAMILPASLSTVNAMYQGKDRAVAFAIWGSTIGGTAALGPLIGGWLTTSFGWQWAFLINVPIGLCILYGLLHYVPETKDPDAKRGFDLAGTALSIVGLSALVFGLIEGQRYGWWTPMAQFSAAGIDWPLDSIAPSAFAFALFVTCLLLFIFLERRRARANAIVLLDFRLFDIRSFRYGNVAALIVSLGEFGLLFALPLFLQSVIGYSAFDTGIVLLSLALGTFAASPGAAKIANRYGGRTVVRLGLALEVVGIVGIGVVASTSATGWTFAPWLFVYGIGVGFATAQLTGVIMADIPVQESGQGSAMQSTSRQIGAALGTAILGAVLLTSLGRSLSDGLTDAGFSAADSVRISSALKSEPTLLGMPADLVPQQLGITDQVRAVADEAFVTALRDVALVGAGWVLLGLISTLLLPKESTRRGGTNPPTGPAVDAGAESEQEMP